MSEIRFFVHCPRGFANERQLMASDNADVIRNMERQLGGASLELEEVTEGEAKRLVYRSGVPAVTESMVLSVDEDLQNKVFALKAKWDDMVKAMLSDSLYKFGNE